MNAEFWVPVTMVAFVLAVGLSVSALSCHSRWVKSGYETSWGPLQGCNIKVDGRWIPEDRYRDFSK